MFLFDGVRSRVKLLFLADGKRSIGTTALPYRKI